MTTPENHAMPAPWSEAAPPGGALAVAPRLPLARPERDGALEEPAPVSGGALSAYLHAFRRRWLVAVLAGVMTSVAAGAAVFLLYGPRYTATAVLKVSALEERFSEKTPHLIPNYFDIFKSSQQQYLKTPMLAEEALVDKGIAGLEMLAGLSDKARWIANQIRVEFPGNSELMLVSMTGPDPKQAAELTNAVVNAYLTNVVKRRSLARTKRREDLEEIYKKQAAELREKFNQLGVKAGENQGQVGNRESLNLQQQVALTHYATLRKELVSLGFDLSRAQSDLKLLEDQRGQADKAPVTDTDLDMIAHQDPTTGVLGQEAAMVRRIMGGIVAASRPGAMDMNLKRYEFQLQSVQAQMQARREELRQDYQRRRPVVMDAKLSQLQSAIRVLQAQWNAMSQETEKAGEEARKFGKQSVEVETLRAEIASREENQRHLDREIAALKIDESAEERVTLVQEALPPKVSDKARRLALIAFAMFGGFVLPAGTVVLLDARARRVNSKAEVGQVAGLRVLGTVPLIPARAMAGEIVDARDQQFRAMLSESVDAIAARLIHKARADQVRTVLVASAAVGEGKTTLASQLAMSFARTHHKVLLLDFDLRQPSLDEAFGLAATPGISEVLRGEATLEAAVQATAVPNLALLAAGEGDRTALARLATGAASPLLEKLREQFEFIVIDSSPVLPVADVRFICRDVDGVVLAVLRDVSRLPAVAAACEVFAGFGIQPLGAVVTGPVTDLEYQPPAYNAEAWE